MKNIDRFSGDQQERAREDADMEQRQDADYNHNRVGRGEVHFADLAFRFLEIHVHDDPEVIVNGDHSVEHADDCQPVISEDACEKNLLQGIDKKEVRISSYSCADSVGLGDRTDGAIRRTYHQEEKVERGTDIG